jgi:hypothetical protein
MVGGTKGVKLASLYSSKISLFGLRGISILLKALSLEKLEFGS